MKSVYTFVLVAFLALPAVAQSIKRASCDGKQVHVQYTDSEYIVPAEKDQVGCDNLSVAPDERTVAWSVLVENCCTSYPIPIAVVILLDHKKVVVQPGQMIHDWHFVKRGQRIAVLFGPVHGDPTGANLYDSRSGAIIAKWHLKTPTPAWAKPWHQ